MSQITVKTEYIEKLKALGVYDAWLANVKAQYNKYGGVFTTTGEVGSFYDLIDRPLLWQDTKEGVVFWKKIANS